jgi:hypothetical protein
MLQNDPASEGDKADRQRRAFDFIYPNANAVSEGVPFDLRAGETRSAAFNVPEPIWFNVAGRVKGSLPVEDHSHISILFQRNMGILEGVGGLGFRVETDGSFEGMLLRGAYAATIHEMTNPEPNGYTRSRRQFCSTEWVIERDTLNLEMPMQ